MKPVRAKKKLGQHFLTDLTIARRIAETLDFQKYSNIIEIGPGMGVLTQFLVSETQSLNLVEIDSESVAYLKNTYDENQVNLIEGDFLKLDFKKTFGEEPFAIIGNFPYNISSQILFKSIDNHKSISGLIGMFQKEVAERIISKNNCKQYGILSVKTQLFYDTKILFNVSPNVFFPKPKVNSSLLIFTPKEDFIK